MGARIVLYEEHQIDPTTTAARLHVMQEVRTNLRREHLRVTGKLYPTPLLDASIERLEELLAMHLPAGPGGLQ